MHLALIRPDNSIEIHEELPATEAPDRLRMLDVQVDLYSQLEGKPGYRVYRGEIWPPTGQEEVEAGGIVSLRPVAPPEPASAETPAPVEAPAQEPA